MRSLTLFSLRFAHKWSSRKLLLQALEIEERYKITFGDALIVQAAGSCGAEAIYSEDLADGQSYGDVRVINPLK